MTNDKADLVMPRVCAPTQSRAAKGFALLTVFFVVIFVPVERIAASEARVVRPPFFAFSFCPLSEP